MKQFLNFCVQLGNTAKVYLITWGQSTCSELENPNLARNFLNVIVWIAIYQNSFMARGVLENRCHKHGESVIVCENLW